jgi:hypothetical protein
MFFFSAAPKRKATDEERLALSEVIKGVHKATAKTAHRLTCPDHNQSCMKLTSDGYVKGKYSRMKCMHIREDGTVDSHSLPTLALWYQVPTVPEELFETLHGAAVEYPPPRDANVICRPCPVKYATPVELEEAGLIEEEEDEDDEPPSGAPMSPTLGIKFKSFGESIGKTQTSPQQNTLGASRQNITDQWENDESPETKENFQTPKLAIKKRQATSPAVMIATPNPYQVLSKEEKKMRMHFSPATRNEQGATPLTPRTPSPTVKRTIPIMVYPKPQALVPRRKSPLHQNPEDEEYKQEEVITSKVMDNQKYIAEEKKESEVRQVKRFFTNQTQRAQQQQPPHQRKRSSPDQRTQEGTSFASLIGVGSGQGRRINMNEEQARAVLSGVNIHKTTRTPLTEVLVANLRRNRKGEVRQALRFFKVDTKIIVDMHWKDRNAVNLVVPRDKVTTIIEQLRNVPGAQILDTFDPLDTIDLQRNPKYFGKSEAELLEECAKLARERYDRAIESLPDNRKGTKAYYIYRQASIENEKKRRAEALRAPRQTTDTTGQMDAFTDAHEDFDMEAELAPPPLSPLTDAALKSTFNPLPCQ